MLKVNVGLSRKLTRDYNSTGFSVNIEGEVAAPPNDAEGVVEGIKELYDLAEEALALQIERHQSDSAVAGRDQEPQRRQPTQGNGHRNSSGGNGNRRHSQRPHDSDENGRSDREPEPATHKQINYLLSLAKQRRLSTIQLEGRIEEVLEEPVGIYELTKREAARVIDEMTSERTSRSRR